MYDALTMRYRFPCPTRGEATVALSSFRRVDRLPGTGHPALFRVSFACPCGEEHPGLVSHDELDWAPLGLGHGPFLNLMTTRLEPVADELAERAARRIGAGEWPWTFFCYPEGRPRPVSPSSFRLLQPAFDDLLGLAVRCPGCAQLSINVVSRLHVDLPFYNDAEVGVVEQLFVNEELWAQGRFGGQGGSGSLEPRRLFARE